MSPKTALILFMALAPLALCGGAGVALVQDILSRAGTREPTDAEVMEDLQDFYHYGKTLPRGPQRR